MPNPLGDHLHSVRKVQGLSLKAVAEPAQISAAYLQKLEGGDVQQPSPHVLQRLSEVLSVPYRNLMELAGYLMPERHGALTSTTFEQALHTADLDDAERKAVAAFIAHLREQRS